MDYLLIYLIIINALGFTLMLADKHKAQKNKWRIPEFVLLCVAYFGGGIGSLLAMHLVRHKTKKEAFYVGTKSPKTLKRHFLLKVSFFL